MSSKATLKQGTPKTAPPPKNGALKQGLPIVPPAVANPDLSPYIDDATP